MVFSSQDKAWSLGIRQCNEDYSISTLRPYQHADALVQFRNIEAEQRQELSIWSPVRRKEKCVLSGPW